jgi:N6-L-threonylcarbamoyladenine synthase
VERACLKEDVQTVLVSGGVACNRRLRNAFQGSASAGGYRLYLPSPVYTTDNAAMIAAAGFLHLEQGRFAPLEINADPNLKL